MRTSVGEKEETIFTKPTIIKNLVVVAMGAMLLLGSNDVLLTFQSTLNRQGGIGIASIMLQYFLCVVATFLLPKYFILRFGCKATMVLGGLSFLPFFVSNYYPVYSLMIASSVVISIGYALFFGVVDTYINNLAFLYDRLCAREAVKPAGTHVSLSIDIKADGVICAASATKGIATIHSACLKVDCIGNTYEGGQNSDGNGEVSGELGSSETLSNFRHLRCISEDQNPTATTCNCINKHDIDSTSQINQTFDINIEKTCKNHPKTNDNEEICNYPSDIIKYIHSAHYNVVGMPIEKLTTVNQIVYDDNFKKVQKRAHVFSISKCKTIINQTDDEINSQCSEKDTKNTNLESITVRFFGFYSTIYQTCYVWSSVVSFFVLQTGFTQDSLIFSNETCLCGSSYCNVETACSENNLRQPSAEARISLVSVCVALAVIACVVFFVLLDDSKPKDKSVSFSLDVLLATFRQMKKTNQILLAPLTIYIGMMRGFYLGDFTKSYVGCAWGIRNAGLVTACAGASMAITSCASGWFGKYLGRMSILVTSAVLNVALNVTLLVWVPDSNLPSMFFVTAGLWGALFGVFNTHIRAFYGVLFRKDEQAAFCVYLIWYCIGSCLTLGLSNFICNDTKIYLLMAVSTVGVTGFLAVEWSLWLMKKRESTSH